MQIYAFKLDILTFKHLINILKLRYAQQIKRGRRLYIFVNLYRNLIHKGREIQEIVLSILPSANRRAIHGLTSMVAYGLMVLIMSIFVSGGCRTLSSCSDPHWRTVTGDGGCQEDTGRGRLGHVTPSLTGNLPTISLLVLATNTMSQSHHLLTFGTKQ